MSAPRFIAAGLGFLWFIAIGGAPTLNPRNVAWLLEGDWLQHWMGFLFFQQDSWRFPLGSLRSLMFPVGTNIGFLDANPLLSIAMKPFARWLSGEYQLMGIWLAVCFTLHGYAAAALVGVVTRDRWQQVFGAALIILSPVLVGRIGHDTLCAQWLLLGLLYLGLREYDAQSVRTVPWKVLGATCLAATIHPYLTAMSWVLGAAVLFRIWRERWMTSRRFFISVASATGGMFAVWGGIGYLQAGRDQAGGFGALSFDLLGFINPRGFSRVLPDLASLPSHEGFAFLGLGGLAALVVAVIAVARFRPRPQNSISVVLAACLLMTLYALSSSVRIGGAEILNVRWLYAPFDLVVGAFRSSGRFIWPLHYLVLLFGIWGLLRISGDQRRGLGAAMLAIAVILQACDLKTDPSWTRPKNLPGVAVEPYELARGHYQHLALSPMQVPNVCTYPFQEEYVFRFMRLAHTLGLTLNSANPPRVDWPVVRAACDAEDQALEAGRLDDQTVYIAADEKLPLFKRAGATCGRWDGNWICVSPSSNDRFRTFIETGR